MQTDYLFNGIRGYSRFKRFSYLLEMENTEANKRLKSIKFFDKYGLEAPIDGLHINNNQDEFSILLDNGSKFKKDFDALLQEKQLTQSIFPVGVWHCQTYDFKTNTFFRK